jgi:hypothetical protein
VRAEVEQQTNDIAYKDASADRVNRELTTKFKSWYTTLEPKLDEESSTFEGESLIQLLSTFSIRWDEQVAHEIAGIDLLALEVRRAAELQRQSFAREADVNMQECARTAPAALEVRQCLLPGTLALTPEGIACMDDVVQGQVFVSCGSAASRVLHSRALPARNRDLVQWEYTVGTNPARRSLRLTTNHALPILRRGGRRRCQLPAADVCVGDNLYTQTGLALVQVVEKCTVQTAVQEIELINVDATMLVAEGQDSEKHHFVEVHGELAPPSSDDYVKLLRFKRFDQFHTLRNSLGLRACCDRLDAAGFSVDVQPPPGKMFVSAHLAERVLKMVEKRRATGDLLVQASTVIVSRFFEHAVLDAVEHELRGRNFITDTQDLTYFLNDEPIDLRRHASLWSGAEELQLKSLCANGTSSSSGAVGVEMPPVTVISVQRTFLHLDELRPGDDETVTMSDYVTGGGPALRRRPRGSR